MASQLPWRRVATEACVEEEEEEGGGDGGEAASTRAGRSSDIFKWTKKWASVQKQTRNLSDTHLMFTISHYNELYLYINACCWPLRNSL